MHWPDTRRAKLVASRSAFSMATRSTSRGKSITGKSATWSKTQRGRLPASNRSKTGSRSLPDRGFSVQTPLEIDSQGMAGTPALKSAIAAHVSELEQRYGRVTACRVVLKAPSAHHHSGGLYEVNIHLSLPQG